jgi:hypothetical protein
MDSYIIGMEAIGFWLPNQVGNRLFQEVIWFQSQVVVVVVGITPRGWEETPCGYLLPAIVFLTIYRPWTHRSQQSRRRRR